MTNSEPPANIPNSDSPNIIVCSDGTWNRGGALNPTNVWRTYLLVEPENQIKFHDNGVGSEGIRPLQIIGGAFGHGISQNLRDLLCFVIQSFQPGSKLFLFGFSRGAFTVRVLADIICMYGIPDKKHLLTKESVEDAAQDLLNCYKDEKATFRKAKKIAAKAIVDGQLTDKRIQETEFYKQNSNIKKFQERYNCFKSYDPDSDQDYLIHFLGCWDTVEALGIPFEPIKRVISQFFPLRFRNTIPHPKIREVCHALSLDDERRAFHPLCFTENDDAPDQIIRQTWFPGNHCHVGGGYLRDQMSIVPLAWMLKHAKAAGLDINEEQFEEYLSTRFVHGQMPHSRKGTNFFYGYHPRRIDEFQKSGPWSIHSSAFHRLGNQIQPYLPTAMVLDTEKISSNTISRVPPDFKPGSSSSQTPNTTPIVYVDNGAPPRKNQKYIPLEFNETNAGIPTKIDLKTFKEYNDLMIEVNDRNVWLGKVLWYMCLILALLCVGFGFLFRNAKTPEDPVQLPAVLFGVEQSVLAIASMVAPQALIDNVFEGYRKTPGALALAGFFWTVLLMLCRRSRRAVERKSLEAWMKAKIVAFEGRTEPQNSIRNLPTSWYRSVTWFWRCIESLFDFFVFCLTGFTLWLKSVFNGGGRLLLYFFKLLTNRPTLVLVIGVATALFWINFNHQWKHWHAVEIGKSKSTDFTKDNEPISLHFDTKTITQSTDLCVSPGEVYSFKIKPDDKWEDWYIESSPTGHKQEAAWWYGWMFWPRRCPGSPTYHLMAKVEPNGKPFEIEHGKSYTIDSDGLLTLFINDVRGCYWNNEGTAEITISRLQSDAS